MIEVGQAVVINHPGKHFGESFIVAKISNTQFGRLAINQVAPHKPSTWVGWLLKDLEPFELCAPGNKVRVLEE